MSRNYDKFPAKKIAGFDNDVFAGYENIRNEVNKLIEQGNRIFVFDFYFGVFKDEIESELKKCKYDILIDVEDCAKSETKLNNIFEEYLTNDRVFGKLNSLTIADCFCKEKIRQAKEIVNDNQDKIIFIIGSGARLIAQGDKVFYFDMARWEIQLRYRNGMPNWHCSNNDAPILTKYKRGFFIEWRIADLHKSSMFDDIDYVVDTNKKNEPKMITGKAFRAALNQVSNEPFRCVPYFDPGVWGGQWMKEKFNLDQNQKNFAWSFDGVPEENSLLFNFNNVIVELPCIDLVLYKPKELLGERVYNIFGAEFPIRFDLLDTMDGGNLSMQVHPLKSYIKEQFGMSYTQDESYYILDAKEEENPCVYLGVKNDVDKNAMFEDLEKANKGEILFPDEKYVNKFPAKKHDYFLIPSGTVHCSGANTMVLEISATPYIFTFKMWDWGRIGLDGLPRPVHLNHAKNNVQWNRNTQWVKDNLINHFDTIYSDDKTTIEKVELEDLFSVSSKRYTFSEKIKCSCDGSVNVLNLVDGEIASITSCNNEFLPFVVHYAETVIIPANVKEYYLTSLNGSAKAVVASIKEG